jgi:hypothetical protein
MANLSTLKLSAAAKPTGVTPAQFRRNKLSKRLWEQIELARAQAAGNTFTVKRFRTLKQDDGSRRSVEVPKRVRQWWWLTENNKLAMNLRYGARAVELAKGKTAIEIASVDDLVPTLEILKTAVEAGELDSQIELASVKLREGFKK